MTISGKMIDKIYNAKERMELYDTERTCWFKNTAVPYTASSYTGNLLKNDFTEPFNGVQIRVRENRRRHRNTF